MTSERSPWLSQASREETERVERRRLFEQVMADEDRGDIDRATALAILGLTDAVLDLELDPGQPALFEVDGTEGA